MDSFWRLAFGSCLFLVAAACSDDDPDADDDNDASERASCTFPSDDGPTCVDYRGDAAFVEVLRNSCAQSADGILTEGELCPTAGVSGICSDEGSDRSRLVYYDVTDGLAELEAACTSNGGTWTPG
jgi:hypothetical protein